MVQRGDDLMTALKALNDKATRIPQADQGFLATIRRIDESFPLADADAELEQRDKTYFVIADNQLANPYFTDDLTSWDEVISRLAAQFVRANSEYLWIADNASLTAGDINFTIATWVYLDTKTDHMGIVGKWASRQYLLWYRTDTDRFRFITSFGGSNPEVNADSFGAVPTGTWNFIVVRHDPVADTMSIQVNDGAIDSVAHTTGISTGGSADFALGSRGDSAFWLNGRMAPTAIWKKVLTAAEATWLYNARFGRFYNEIGLAGPGSALKTSLEAWWDLDEASGTRVDSDGSNNLADINTVTSADGVAGGGDVTATTARDTTQSKTLFGSLASLKVDMTGSTGAGLVMRFQTVTAAVSEAWSYEAWVYAPVLTNCKAVLQIEWLDVDDAVLATETVEITAINSAFALIQLENEVAPTSTTQVRVSLVLEATGSGAVGTAYFDLTRAEQNKTTVTDREDRFIVGEAVVTA